MTVIHWMSVGMCAMVPAIMLVKSVTWLISRHSAEELENVLGCLFITVLSGIYGYALWEKPILTIVVVVILNIIVFLSEFLRDDENEEKASS